MVAHPACCGNIGSLATYRGDFSDHISASQTALGYQAHLLISLYPAIRVTGNTPHILIQIERDFALKGHVRVGSQHAVCA